MKVMLDMVHPRVYSVHVCLLSHYVGRFQISRSMGQICLRLYIR